MGKNKAPDITVPDPAESIRQQAQANRVNTFTPFGALKFSGANRDTASLTLTPGLQRAANQIIARAGQDQDPASFVSALQDRTMGRLNQDFDLRQDRLQEQLAQTGNPSVGADLAPGAVSELDVLNRARNDAIIGALLGAEQVGSQIGFNNAILPFNQLSQLGGIMSGQTNITQPINTLAAQQLTQNAQQAQLDAANQASQGKNSVLGDIIGAGASIYAASDKALKDNIVRIGALENGLGWYQWEWNDKAKDIGADKYANTGVIAQEVMEYFPEAVVVRDGYLHVDYSRII